ISQAMDEESSIAKDDLRQLFHRAISTVMTSCTPNSKKYQKLQSLPLKLYPKPYKPWFDPVLIHRRMGFDDAFEGVRSLRDFEEAQEDLSNETIETNLRVLKGNLKKSEARYAKPLRKII
ncbi:25626_t:CDS:2, partial [Gigaspora rosea]